jgi:hypothetical protein
MNLFKDSVSVLLSQKDFEMKFKPAEREISRLREKITMTRHKFGLFKVHKFSLEELYQHLSKIGSIIEKIGDDISQWETSEQLTYFEKSLYMKYRSDVEIKLHELEKMIEDRDPTFWEEIFDLFTSRITQIMEYLPEFMVFSLPRFLLGKGFHRVQRLLKKAK